MSAGLDCRVGLHLGALRLDAHLVARPGELVVLVGPNGAGKTTLLRVLAGLVALDSGRVTLDDVVLDEPGTNSFVPAERRGVGVVFQHGLLFEHLDVVANVAFGLRARGAGRRDARRSADAWLTRLGVGELARARPSQLSGGQAQRVALARALAFEPRLLLLDEPFSALDATTRVEIRRIIAAHLAGIAAPKILVTHDPIEALALADTVVVLEAGRVTQSGSPDDVRRAPRSRYVADLLGVNLLRGTLRDDTVALDTGTTFVVAARDVAHGPVIVTVHPRAILLSTQRPQTSARNSWPATIADLDDDGDRVRIRLAPPLDVVVEITTAARHALALAPGTPVWASCKATELVVQPA